MLDIQVPVEEEDVTIGKATRIIGKLRLLKIRLLKIRLALIPPS